MKLKRFTVPIYRYDVTFIEIESPDDAPKVAKILKRLPDYNHDDLDYTMRSIKEMHYGGEHTYSVSSPESIIIIYRWSNKLEHLSTISHEKRHLEDRIAEYLGIKDREAIAYLSGWLSKKLLADLL
jgi:hypothetical protein